MHHSVVCRIYATLCKHHHEFQNTSITLQYPTHSSAYYVLPSPLPLQPQNLPFVSMDLPFLDILHRIIQHVVLCLWFLSLKHVSKIHHWARVVAQW